MKKSVFQVCLFCFFSVLVFIGNFAVKTFAEDAAPGISDCKGAEIHLFDGKTINDFDFYLADDGKKEDVFHLEDGILKVSGTPFGWLSPKGISVRNFTLKVEVRYPQNDPKPNSGLFLRIVDSEPRPEPKFLPPCFECQLQTGNIGHLFGFHGHVLRGPADRYIYRARSENGGKFQAELHKLVNFQTNQKPGTESWNLVEVTCYEDLIFVRVNGVLVNWAHDALNVEGKIGFQSEGGEVWFRNAVLYAEPSSK